MVPSPPDQATAPAKTPQSPPRGGSTGPKDFLLFEKWMDTTVWLFQRTQRFPKTMRHTLTQRMEGLTLEVLECVTDAGFRHNKEPSLARADAALNRLRVLIRLAHELNVLSVATYGESIERMAECGRIVGALRRRPASSARERQA